MTNATLMFDTLQYAKKLQKAGVPEQQAEIQAEAFKEQNVAINNWIDDNLTTKRDLKELELAFKHDIKELDLKIEAIKKDIVIQLGSIVVGCFGILATLIVIFQK